MKAKDSEDINKFKAESKDSSPQRISIRRLPEEVWRLGGEERAAGARASVVEAQGGLYFRVWRACGGRQGDDRRGGEEVALLARVVPSGDGQRTRQS